MDEQVDFFFGIHQTGQLCQKVLDVSGGLFYENAQDHCRIIVWLKNMQINLTCDDILMSLLNLKNGVRPLYKDTVEMSQLESIILLKVNLVASTDFYSTHQLNGTCPVFP